jgi:hypothetical protein
MFRGLIDQELPLHRNEHWACLSRRIKGGKRIAAIRQRCSQACGVQPRRDEVAPQMMAFGFVHRWVEFDQNIAGFDGLSVTDMDGAHDPGLKGLHDLGAVTRDDLARRGGDDINPAQGGPSQRQAENASNCHCDGPSQWRGRHLHDLERRGQEGDLFAIPAIARAWQRDDIVSWPHGARPADDEASRSARLS